jgi:hypothetical protein
LYPEPNMHQRQQFAAIITTFLFGYAIMSLWQPYHAGWWQPDFGLSSMIFIMLKSIPKAHLVL